MVIDFNHIHKHMEVYMNKNTVLSALLLVITVAVHARIPDDQLNGDASSEAGSANISPVTIVNAANVSPATVSPIPTIRRSPIFQRVLNSGSGVNEIGEAARIFPQNQHQVNGLPAFYSIAAVVGHTQRNMGLQYASPELLSPAQSTLSDESTLCSILEDDDFELDEDLELE